MSRRMKWWSSCKNIKKRNNKIYHSNSFHSSFSRIRSEELNDMGYGLSKISPITFDGDAFQTPSNRAQDGAPMLTPRRRRNEVNTESIPPAQAPQQDGNAKPYNAELSVAGNGSNKPSCRFVPPQPNNTGSSSQEMDNSNTTTVYYEKSTGKHQNKSTSIQMSPRHPESRGTTTTTHKQKTKRLHRLVEPKLCLHHSSKKSTSTGGTQTSTSKM